MYVYLHLIVVCHQNDLVITQDIPYTHYTTAAQLTSQIVIVYECAV